MAGEHGAAISRLDDLIATVRFNSICYVVQVRHTTLPHDNIADIAKGKDVSSSWRFVYET